MRRVVLLLCSVFLLASCGSGSNTTTVACDLQFWNGTFGTCLPKGWKVLSQDSLDLLGVPEETVAAFQLSDPRGGQFDTVTVTREPLNQDMDTTEYSKANVVAVSTLPDYKLIDKKVVYIDAKESAIHVFSARPATDAPIRRYYQAGSTSGKMGYIFTGSFPLSVTETEASEVEYILQNITFVDPATKAAAKE